MRYPMPLAGELEVSYLPLCKRGILSMQNDSKENGSETPLCIRYCGDGGVSQIVRKAQRCPWNRCPQNFGLPPQPSVTQTVQNRQKIIKMDTSPRAGDRFCGQTSLWTSSGICKRGGRQKGVSPICSVLL